jgi:prophage regulatory protein
MPTQKIEPIGRILRLRDLVTHKKRDGTIRTGKLGLGRTQVYKMMAAGTFPKPIQLGLNSVGWKECDVNAWIAARPIANNAPVKRASRG